MVEIYKVYILLFLSYNSTYTRLQNNNRIRLETKNNMNYLNKKPSITDT